MKHACSKFTHATLPMQLAGPVTHTQNSHTSYIQLTCTQLTRTQLTRTQLTAHSYSAHSYSADSYSAHSYSAHSYSAHSYSAQVHTSIRRSAKHSSCLCANRSPAYAHESKVSAISFAWSRSEPTRNRPSSSFAPLITSATGKFSAMLNSALIIATFSKNCMI